MGLKENVPDYPNTDNTGRIHEDIPDVVPPEWPVSVIEDALHEVEESLKNRTREMEKHCGGDQRHQRRYEEEARWKRRLEERLGQLSRIGVGAGLMGVGSVIVGAGLGGSAVIIGDDVTVIGVADDPLLIVTGGAVIVGGGVIAVGGIIDWIGW